MVTIGVVRALRPVLGVLSALAGLVLGMTQMLGHLPRKRGDRHSSGAASSTSFVNRFSSPFGLVQLLTLRRAATRPARRLSCRRIQAGIGRVRATCAHVGKSHAPSLQIPPTPLTGWRVVEDQKHRNCDRPGSSRS